jgi:beta-1,4-mannooligosaccharide phosphorylase
MRTYPIGAILLDLDNPKRILGQLRQQLLSPALDEQDGYVPNVFYSCDALAHAETMVLTYGTGDAAIDVETVSLPELLDGLSPSPTRPRCRLTLCVNNVDMASSRAFTGGLARKPLPAAMRLPSGLMDFRSIPRIIGSRPLNDADARRNTGTHACAHPYRRTTTTMKKSDHQIL